MLTDQQLKDLFAANPNVTDTQWTQTARENSVDPGMIARVTGRPVTEIYAAMANVPQNKPSYWQPRELAAVRDFAAKNPSPDEIYAAAQNLGLSADQLASVWSQATGSNLKDTQGVISNYLQDTGRSLKGGYTTQNTPLPSYNTYLDNLMSNMNPQGGMMGFDMPALATSSYVRPTLSNLNDVRQQAYAAYDARQAEEAAAAMAAKLKKQQESSSIQPQYDNS